MRIKRDSNSVTDSLNYNFKMRLRLNSYSGELNVTTVMSMRLFCSNDKIISLNHQVLCYFSFSLAFIFVVII